MIYGIGPENIVFPMNGTVSSSLKDSGIVKDAKNNFYNLNKGNRVNLKSYSGEISGTTFKNNLRSLFANSIFHPESLIGSAHIRIEQYNDTMLKITIFNITSVTSGDFMKHLPWNEYPLSKIRMENDKEYGNTSQTYSFTEKIDFSRLK